DAPRLSALREQAAYLDAHRAEWGALSARAAKRFEARVITSVELHELRWMIESLERRLVQVHGEVQRLDAIAEPRRPPVSLASLSARYRESAEAFDEAAVRLRGLDAWTFKVSGGVIPLPGQPFDWFGIAEVGYNLGGISERNNLAVAAGAHIDDLMTSRREMPARLAKLRRELTARIAGVREELKTVGAQLTMTPATAPALHTPHAQT